MKITNHPCPSHYALSCVPAGDTLQFKSCLAQKHAPDDLFMVVGVCSSYRPGDYKGRDKYAGKLPVVNLRTGELAYVEKSRPCYPQDAEVCLR